MLYQATATSTMGTAKYKITQCIDSPIFGDKNPLISPTNPYIIVRPIGLHKLTPLGRFSNIIENMIVKAHAKETNGEIARMPSTNSLDDEAVRIFDNEPPWIPTHNIIHKLNGMK